MEIEALAVDRQQQMESNSRYLKNERDRAKDELDNDMHITIDSSFASTKGLVQKSDQGSQYTTGLVEEPHMGIYEKGTKDDTEEFIYQLLDVSEDGIVGSTNNILY
ncbi:hypothetical protein DVH24_003792 [Malus domestica]|uniref:Uncharacterized protein n=1 Tax=Malus domestica TaxID=3750 RepID=A0A498K4F7_MALDO|nr:hypothetical protein DVH24_003792 [Malus domestica]